MAISVNEVYTTVLYIINKNGSGYLTPDNFNKIARLSQLDLLEKAFEDYNRALLRQKRGGIGAGYADIPEKIKDKIDVFYKTGSFDIITNEGLLIQTIFSQPVGRLISDSIILISSNEAQTIRNISFEDPATRDDTVFEKPILVDGVDSGAVAEITIAREFSLNETTHRVQKIDIIEAGSSFEIGDVLKIPIQDKTSDGTREITLATTSSLINNIFGEIQLPTVVGDDGVYQRSDVYKIIDVTSNNRKTSIERIDKHKLSYILSSPLTSPTENFPVYYQQADQLIIEPAATAKTWSLGNIIIDYISVPEDPIFNFDVDDETYGSPVYSPVSGGVDFTLHPSEEVDLIIRILQYAGISINDLNIVQQAINEKQLQTNQENT